MPQGAWLTVVAVVALVLGELRHSAPMIRVAKPLASLGFVVTAWQLGALAHPIGRTLLVALVLCAIGDLCLLSRAKLWFLAGLGAFLLGHLGYIVAFVQRGVSPAAFAVLAIVLSVPAISVWRWLRPHVEPPMRPAVLAYVATITVMIASAWACAWPAGIVLARVGATAFYLSDLSVARDVFVAPGVVNRVWGLPLYYGAQLCIAFAAAG
jgi:uncharacterized membrane protein YhhN